MSGSPLAPTTSPARPATSSAPWRSPATTGREGLPPLVDLDEDSLRALVSHVVRIELVRREAPSAFLWCTLGGASSWAGLSLGQPGAPLAVAGALFIGWGLWPALRIVMGTTRLRRAVPARLGQERALRRALQHAVRCFLESLDDHDLRVRDVEERCFGYVVERGGRPRSDAPR